MVLASLQFLISVSVLLLSTNSTIRYAEKLSKALRISPLIIGTTVVAIGTSLPELVIGLAAVFSNDRSLAVGNVVGSNVVNVFLILPVAIFLGNIRIGTTKTQINALILGIVTILFITFQMSTFPNVVSGFIFLLAAGVISVIEYKMGLFGRDHEDLRLFAHLRPTHFTGSDYLSLGIAIVGVIVGGISTVNATHHISTATGISTTALGLSLTALATSLPELSVSIASRKKEREKLSIGNILGSNIYNLLLVAGVLNIFSQQHVAWVTEWGYLAFSSMLLMGIIWFYKGRVIQKAVGAVLIGIFIGYLWILFM